MSSRSERCLASSVRRAAAFTASPMTVYSKRPRVPMLPARTGRADLAAEQVAQHPTFAQAFDHRVEAVLELADLAAVVDGYLNAELFVLDRGHRGPDRLDRVGNRLRREQDHDRAGHQTHT